MSQLAVSLVGLVASTLDGRSPGPVKSKQGGARSVSELVLERLDPAQKQKGDNDLVRAFYKGLGYD
jgi:hypothetical protein